MRIIQSNFNRLQRDFESALMSDEITLGYIVNKTGPMIWDPVWVKAKGKLTVGRFNIDAARQLVNDVYPLSVIGGIIINNIDDISFLLISNDAISNWEAPLMRDFVIYLRKKYGIPCYIDNNDILVNNKKIIAVSHGWQGDKRISAMFISMNNTTNELIDIICTKKQKYDGSDGLMSYGVNKKDIIQFIIKFTEAWEARKI